MLVLLYYFVCVDTCVVKYPIEYRMVVYLSDTASECVLQELPRAVDSGIMFSLVSHRYREVSAK